MNRRKALVGLCMLCALLTSAFAAQSASAIEGTTAVTCATSGTKQVGTETFNTDHCVPGEGAGSFKHWEVPQDKTTTLSGAAGSETEKLKATVGGVPIVLTSTSASGIGTMENRVDASGEHYLHGEFTIIFKGVTVNVAKCFVYKDVGGKAGAKGEITTNLLTATTTGQGMGVKFSPAAGGPFKTLIIDDNTPEAAPNECAIAKTYECSGSVVGTPSGATIVFEHGTATTGTTGQGTFKLGPTGSPVIAGIEGSATLKGEGTPLAATTVTT